MVTLFLKSFFIASLSFPIKFFNNIISYKITITIPRNCKSKIPGTFATPCVIVCIDKVYFHLKSLGPLIQQLSTLLIFAIMFSYFSTTTQQTIAHKVPIASAIKRDTRFSSFIFHEFPALFAYSYK